MSNARRLAAGVLLAAAVVAFGLLLLRSKPRPAPIVEAHSTAGEATGEAVGTVVPADSLNTPPALLAGLFEAKPADPGRDATAQDLPLPAIEPAPVTPEVVPPPPPADSSANSTLPAPPPTGEAPGADAAANSSGGSNDAEGARGVLEPPVVLKAAWLQYPEGAKRRKIEGNVEVRILVDTRGGVASVALEQGASDTSLDSAALAAAQTMRFRPAMQDDEPVAVWFNYRFSFRLPP